MKFYKEDTVAHLKADLTQSGVICNIVTLLGVSLQKIVSGGYKKIRIDCEMIHKADNSGLQILYVWMQSARTRGVEPELINVSNSLRQDMQKIGFDQCFKGVSNNKLASEFTESRKYKLHGKEGGDHVDLCDITKCTSSNDLSDSVQSI
jgi:anti-anti-sigma regulatory factor